MASEASALVSDPSASPAEEVQEEVPVEVPPVAKQQKKEKRRAERAYAPTPKQLEALTKARQAKQAKRKKVTFEEPPAKEPEPQEQEPFSARHVAEEPDSPVEVVRDNKLLQEFASSANVVVAPTGLGRKRKARPEVAESGTWERPGGAASLSGAVGFVGKAAAVTAVAAAAVAGGYYVSKRLRTQAPAPPQAAEQAEPAAAAGSWWSVPAVLGRGPRAEAAPSTGTIPEKAPWER